MIDYFFSLVYQYIVFVENLFVTNQPPNLLALILVFLFFVVVDNNYISKCTVLIRIFKIN